MSCRVKALLILATALSIGCSGPNADQALSAAKEHIARKQGPAAIIELKNALQARPDHLEARFLLGKLLLEREDPVGAAIELAKAAGLGLPADEVAPLLATAYRQSAQPRKVIELDGASALTTPAAIAGLKTQLAYARADLGEGADKVEAALAQALQADPQFAPALLLRARVLLSRRDAPAAVRVIDDILGRAPEYADALVLKGEILAIDDPAGAAALFQRALASDPRHVAAHGGLLKGDFASNDLEAARSHLDAMRKARPGHPRTRYFEARLALQTGDAKGASDLAQQLLKIAPNDPELLSLAAVVALQNGEVAFAEQHAGKLARLVPTSAEARRLLATIHLRAGEPQKAMELVRALADSANADFDTLRFAGSVYASMGEFKRAEEVLARAAKAKPADIKTRIALASARIGHGDVQGGLRELRSAASADPGTSADLALIQALVKQPDHAAALKAVEALAKKEPGKALPLYAEGEVRFRMGEAAAARAAFDKALAKDSRFFPAVEGLVALAMRANQLDAARALVKDYLERNPDDTRGLVASAMLDERAGRPKEDVAAALTKAVDLKPDDASLRRALIGYHLRREDPSLALEAARKAVAAIPRDVDLQLLLGRVLRAAGDTQQAIAAYEKIAAAQPGSPFPLMALAQTQLQAKSFDAAAESLKRAQGIAPDAAVVVAMAVKVDVLAGRHDEALSKARALQARAPKLVDGWLLEGDIEMSRSSWSAAAAAFQKALQKQESPQIAQRVYLALRRSGDKARTDAFATDWLKRHRNDAQFLFALATWAIEDKNYDLAAERLEQSLRFAPDSAAALNNLAWVRATQKKPGAAKLAERANELSPNQPLFLDTLAFALAAEGNVTRAVEIQQKAMALSPSAHGLRLQLARLYLEAGDKDAARRELDTLAALGDAFARQGEVASLKSKL
jgi:putative PEP-CTERM system TPR-repeat lipoprotein